jgi:hypothetical protein
MASETSIERFVQSPGNADMRYMSDHASVRLAD